METLLPLGRTYREYRGNGRAKYPNAQAVRARKRDEANERKQTRNERGDKKQLVILSKRPGESKREVARLMANVRKDNERVKSKAA